MNNRTPSIPWYLAFKTGQHYMNSWPEDRRLFLVFPEYKVIFLTRLAMHIMPIFAVFILCWNMLMGGIFSVYMTSLLFAIALPLQGLWWLGFRAVSPLPLAIMGWFDEMCNRLTEAGESVEKIVGYPPTYQNLADVLKLALKHLDNDFFDRI